MISRVVINYGKKTYIGEWIEKSEYQHSLLQSFIDNLPNNEIDADFKFVFEDENGISHVFTKKKFNKCKFTLERQ